MSISIALLDSLPFFEGLDEQTKSQICNIASLKNFNEATTIGRAGDARETAVYVVTGQLQSRQLADDGRVISLSILGPGTWVSWLALVDGRYVSEEIKCLTPCQVVSFPIRLLKPLLQSNTLLLDRLLKLAVHAMDIAQRERMILTLPNAFQRVCFQISHLCGDIDTDTLERLNALPRQQDLASAANTSRETVSRTLQMLVKSGIIRKSGHRMVIRRLDLLRRLAYDGPELLNDDILQVSHPNTK